MSPSSQTPTPGEQHPQSAQAPRTLPKSVLDAAARVLQRYASRLERRS